VWIEWSEYQAPLESRETELCNELYKTKEEQQIFLGFQFLKQNGGKQQKSKIFLDFLNTKPKIAGKANQSWKTKEANKEKQQKYFWSFCVLESRNKNKKQQRKKKTKQGYTKYRQNMICR
jgi:hypothetical protein